MLAGWLGLPVEEVTRAVQSAGRAQPPAPRREVEQAPAATSDASVPPPPPPDPPDKGAGAPAYHAPQGALPPSNRVELQAKLEAPANDA